MKLLNSFGNSMARQIGRDTGRAVAKKILGGGRKGSSPQKKTPKEGYAERFQDEYLIKYQGERITVKEHDLTEEFIRKHFVAEWEFPTFWSYLSPLGFFIFPVLGPLFGLFKSLDLFSQKKIKYQGEELLKYYVQDRRYKEGVRFEGLTSQIVEFEFPATEKEREKLVVDGFFCLMCTICAVGFQYWVWLQF